MFGKILEGPEQKLKIPQKTIGQWLFEKAEEYGNRICQIDGLTDESECYSSVKERSVRVAIALRLRGLTSSDVIALCTSNTIDTVIPMIAAFFLGARVANLEPSLSPAQTRHLLALVRPRIVFVEEGAVSLIEESLRAAGLAAEVVVFGEKGSFGELTGPQEGEGEFRPTEVDIHETAIMFFSSGTTAMPKAVCHSSYTFLSATYNNFELGTVMLHFSPFYWVTAMFLFMYSFLGGKCRIFFRKTDIEKTYKAIEKYKVDYVFLAPSILSNIINFENVKKYNTSSVNIIIAAGGPPNPSQLKKLEELFPNACAINGYGMTEAGCLVGFNPKTDREFIEKKRTSCGRPIVGVKVKIADVTTGETLGPYQKGEVCVKALSLFKEYYEIDSHFAFDKDGFFKTGDIGYYDEDDCLFLVERIKEMFKYQSYQIAPSMLEEALLEHPGIKEAVVFGVPCGEDGEKPAACVVLEDNYDVTKEEIFDFMAKKVSDKEKLRGGIFVLSELPKTPTGKVSRREVKNLVLKK